VWERYGGETGGDLEHGFLQDLLLRSKMIKCTYEEEIWIVLNEDGSL